MDTSPWWEKKERERKKEERKEQRRERKKQKETVTVMETNKWSEKTNVIMQLGVHYWLKLGKPGWLNTVFLQLWWREEECVLAGLGAVSPKRHPSTLYTGGSSVMRRKTPQHSPTQSTAVRAKANRLSDCSVQRGMSKWDVFPLAKKATVSECDETISRVNKAW